MKFNKKHFCRICILLGIYVINVLLITKFKYAYGSKLDWNGQHYAIPDYFRKLFYETGEFFPSFAPNIGGGENIYNLSYYGLYSPIILFSYLLPFVKMSTYIQAVSIIGVMADIVICYIFMNRKFKEKTAFLLTLAFLFSDSLIFHSHSHIMFVNYMPFLLLGMMAVEDYFEKGRNIRISVYAFLIILCCYYYSIPALIAMTVYGVYCFIKAHEKFTAKEFFSAAAGFAVRMIAGVMSAGILLLPTMAAMLGGRDSTNSKIGIFQLLPKVSLNFITGNPYSIGLSCFLLTACIMGIMAKNKSRRFLSIVMALLICCPVFAYILNGGMYIEPKIFIPFLPIGVILIGYAYEDFASGNYHFKPLIITTALALVWGVVTVDGHYGTKVCAYIDSAVLMLCLLCFYKFKRKAFITTAMLGVSCISMLVCNLGCKMPELADINNTKDIDTLADYVSKDDDLVRTSNMINRSVTVNQIYNTEYYTSSIYSSLHNGYFNHFYFEEIRNENEFRNTALTSASQNIIFKTLMGEKYIISDKDNIPTGYTKIMTSGNLSLYENKNVLPVGYSTDKILSEEEYKKLSYPQSVEALSKYIIVPKKTDGVFKSELENCEEIKLQPCDNIKPENGGYIVSAHKKFKQEIMLKKPLKKNQVLLLKFNVDNNMGDCKEDVSVTINGIRNKLTAPDWKYFNHNNSFEYVINTNGKEEIDRLEFRFTKGNYSISTFESYVMEFPNLSADVDRFKADKSKTKGDVISGSINCTKDGWFNLTVPYSEGFKITIDGKECSPQMTDTAFVGFPIQKGHHEINIRFTAPMLKEGKILSLLGLLLIAFLGIFDITVKKRRVKRAEK